MALGTVYGVNYNNAVIATPSVKVHQGEYGGRELVMVDSYTFAAEAAVGDIIKVGRLPAGAKVLGARVFTSQAFGNSAAVNFGNTASNDSSGNDAAVATAFLNAGVISAANADVSDGAGSGVRGGAIGITRFTKSVDAQIAFTVATTSATSGTLYTRLAYIVD